MSLVFLGVVVAGVAGAQTAPTPLPDEMRARYIGGCYSAVDQANDDLNKAAVLCPCSLRAIESSLTPDDYARLVEAARTGGAPPPPPPGVQQAIQACHTAAAVAASAPLPASVQISRATVPLPAGFFAPETMGPAIGVEALRAGGGIIFVQRRRAALEHVFRGSIVILPTEDPPPITEDGCKAFVDKTPGIPQSVAVVQGPNGPRCEVKKTAADHPTRGATFGVLGAAPRSLTVTCNYDVRDRAALDACAEVLDGLRLTP